ncbi:serine/threonine protein kinase [Paraliomyxa miuraensis]|uniref:serine/threonine protein kinase n=1 Tax=Paraliomyxa miuraensis TaxID=376150 RepID=UPI00225ACCDA|nr:serine/threonine-protein kinase [Paraliomyxa miuraensis]MCX4245628.1 protein kinase [Paraliomyxa miuraensis]
MSPPAPFAFPDPGDTFENFEILNEIGRGAFARVYEVLSPDSDEPVALKLTALPNMSVDLVQRAIREIAVLRTLSSPHVVKLHGSSIGEGYFYLVMELLQGQQLNEHHAFDEPMQVAEAVDLMLQVCVGLTEAHAKGVVHRDIKPANLWIQPDGLVKLLDFGLARAWGVPWVYGRNATAARTVVGTPHYTQPEQLYTHELTPASDVYSLATILYELLSGHAVLFAHQTVSEVIEALHDNPLAWLDAHASREMVPITRYPGCAGLPDTLLQLLERALAKDPQQRPQLAGHFASALGDILHYDLGATPAAEVQIRTSGSWRSVPLIPGRRRVGAGEICAVQVTGRELLDVHAHIEWSGFPRLAQIRPAAPGAPITIDGLAVDRVATIRPDAEVQVGPTPLRFVYPERTSSAGA